MSKPDYLYHGTRKKLDLLKPTQGVGYGMADNEHGVYAVSERDLAIPFAISFRPLDDGAIFSVETSKRPPRIVLKNTDVDWGRVGYVYKVCSETFEQIDPEQWLSKVPVEPVETEEIKPESYRDWIVYKSEG
ncbi:hypothetical protein [Vreelandella boliviensis]|uniref:Uncharacterized protein n=1 Tax=Vreelandella boliviensis LC1 TaxID=1072583 RepID=A0ABX4GDM4_9GAMM|nr:hypothetical protein [Halomonas boliviensis]OZT75453.1 hypothetical protein CE457_03410 [Halomonas boliviensis LC1]